MGVQVLVSDPEQLEAIRKREEDITKERLQHIIDAGVNVILTTKGIDDMCQKYLVEKGIMGVRRVKKEVTIIAVTLYLPLSLSPSLVLFS